METENSVYGELVNACYYCGSNNIEKKYMGDLVQHKCLCCGKKNLLPLRLNSGFKIKKEKTISNRKYRGLVCKYTGKKLTSDKAVHHIDTSRTNNSKNNLFVCSAAEHNKIHCSLKKLIKQLIKNNKIIFDKKKMVYKYEM